MVMETQERRSERHHPYEWVVEQAAVNDPHGGWWVCMGGSDGLCRNSVRVKDEEIAKTLVTVHNQTIDLVYAMGQDDLAASALT